MPADLASVEAAAKAAREAREQLEQAIADAAAAGASLRQLAVAAGLNHETVRTILRRRAAA